MQTVKNFLKTQTLRQMGYSTSVPIVISKSWTAVGCSSSSQLTTLHSLAIPEGTFATDGDVLDFFYYGDFRGTTGLRLIASFLDYDFLDTGVFTATSGEGWSMYGRMVRASSTTANVCTTWCTPSKTQPYISLVTKPFSTDLSITLSALGPSQNDVEMSASMHTLYSQEV